MASPWQGGDLFIKIRRGSKVSRHGGTNSGNAGGAQRFRIDFQNRGRQSIEQKEINKTAPRVLRWKNRRTVTAEQASILINS